MISVG